MTLRVGIVSAAWGGFAHLPAWRAVPGVEVTAICTSREETALAAAARLRIGRPFWDAAAMCADPDIDIVDCGTRPVVRLPMVLAALASRKHVYNACPHAPDWPGAKAIDTAWRASGCVGVVDAFSRWLPAHRKLAELIQSGFIGRPLGGSCRFALSLFNRPDKRFPYNWFGQAGQGVSALRNNGSHLLFLLLELLGPVDEVCADDHRHLSEWRFSDGERQAVETNDDANALLRFASGVSLTLHASWAMPAAEGWRIDLFGDEGRVAVSAPTFPTARDCMIQGARTGETLAPIDLDAKPPKDVALGWDAEPPPSVPMALSMHAMVGAIAGGAAAKPDFGAALEVERVQEALRRSSLERRWVSIAEID
ncbi:Gfo/Idh/MocA family protein [Sphingomonas tabacisoli]|uniref:Gfo/Idh/MocA family protein n=1 Tax=Sphingomonas tabacisoli TaxID=2249466 RepID=A0ABW4I7L8_9SPHN